jgi:O-antigen/teichoic acid export membrane protein
MINIITWVKNTMVTSRKGIEDVIVSMIPKVVALIAGLITTVLIARGLGPDGMGKYALIMSISGLVVGLSDLGIGQTAIRFASRAVSQDNTQNQFAILRWAFRLRISIVFLITVTFFVLAETITVKIWHVENLTSLVRLSLLIGIFGAIASVPIIYFQSLKRFKTNTLVSVGQTIISLIGILIVAWLGFWSLDLVIFISIVSAGLAAFAFLLLVPKETLFTISEMKALLKTKVKNIWFIPERINIDSKSIDSSGINTFAVYMILSTIIVMITMRADIWLMGFFLDKNDIGLYSVASRFALPLIMILGALNTALWPRAASLSCPKQVVELLRKTFRISLLIAGGAVVYAYSAPFLAPLIFGPTYDGLILIAQVLSFRYCISILMCPIGIIGYSFGMVKTYWWINIVQFIAVVVISVMFLPKIGLMASALALIANELVGFSIVGILIYRKINSMEE